MTDIRKKPEQRPGCPYFSSGPCAKHPGWSLEALKDAALGRSHRAALGKGKLKQLIEETKERLGLPEGYKIGIMPGSDTGAFEAALWSLLGARPVDLFAWESFGKGWVSDCVKELKLLDTRAFVAPFGQLPDLTQADFRRDVVFTWNGTTSGVIVPDGDWISDEREGLTICDATSSVFAVKMPWKKLDVVTFSWQKALGGEGQHGMLILSPRAVERLESFEPDRPIPKLFRLTQKGKLKEEIFEGSTLNTPSMLCVEDMLDALAWARRIGGGEELMRRTQNNADVIEAWLKRSGWLDYLAEDRKARSPTSVCLKAAAPDLVSLSEADQRVFFKKIAALLEEEGVAYDIGAYRDAPPGLRIWCGATVESQDLETLTLWLDWAYDILKEEKARS